MFSQCSVELKLNIRSQYKNLQEMAFDDDNSDNDNSDDINFDDVNSDDDY